MRQPGWFPIRPQVSHRLTHQGQIAKPGNEFYRLLHSTKTAKGQIKAREQSRKGGVKEAEVELQAGEPF